MNAEWVPVVSLASAAVIGLVAAGVVGGRFRHPRGRTLPTALVTAYGSISAFVFTFLTRDRLRHGGRLHPLSAWLGDAARVLIVKSPGMLVVSFIAAAAPAILTRPKRPA